MNSNTQNNNARYTLKYGDDWFEIWENDECVYANHYINPEDIFDILAIPYTVKYLDEENDN